LQLKVIKVAVYPSAQSGTYVKATTTLSGDYEPYFATDPTLSLTGSDTGNNWWTTNPTVTNQRFHIDLGIAEIATRIYYENAHSGGSVTDRGANNFTLWGSNNAAAFAELTYGTDTNWTQITGLSQSTFDQHTASDVVDPKYITFTNSTAYRYYAFKIADNHGSGAGIGLRHVELQTARYFYLDNITYEGTQAESDTLLADDGHHVQVLDNDGT
jgi:hypothetical protein